MDTAFGTRGFQVLRFPPNASEPFSLKTRPSKTLVNPKLRSEKVVCLGKLQTQLTEVLVIEELCVLLFGDERGSGLRFLGLESFRFEDCWGFGCQNSCSVSRNLWALHFGLCSSGWLLDGFTLNGIWQNLSARVEIPRRILFILKPKPKVCNSARL